MSVLETAQAAKRASVALATTTSEQRNLCLTEMAQALRRHTPEIIEANDRDMKAAARTVL